MSRFPLTAGFALALAILAVSWGAILVRLCQAPSLVIAFYRLGLATVILIPFALATGGLKSVLPAGWSLALVASSGYAELAETIRETHRLACQQHLLDYVRPALTAPIKEQACLAKYLTGYVNELFVFVQYPEVPSENNPAERAIRPLVITRKVCGGTRSAQGSNTKMVLMSLLHTAQLRGMDPIAAIEGMLLDSPMFATA